jgi:methylthioribose-1-phosphate isomerase
MTERDENPIASDGEEALKPQDLHSKVQLQEVLMTPEEEEEKICWESWLDPELGRELERVKGAVERLFEAARSEPPLPFFTPHGPEHCKAVEDLLHRLIPKKNYIKLRRMERFCLLASAWLHDLGMIRSVAEYAEKRPLTDDEVRSLHHTSSQQFIINEPTRCGLKTDCTDVLGLLAKYHRKKEDLTKCPEKVTVRGEVARVRVLAAYLRLADALDVGGERVPEEAYAICLAYDIPSEVKLHWIKNKIVNCIRINTATHDLTVEFKVPPPEVLAYGEISEEWMKQRLHSIKALVCDDLREELLSVQNILRKELGELPFYLDVESDQFETKVDSQMANDLRELITNYDIMVLPTASKLIEMILITAANIAGFSLDKNQKFPVPLRSAKIAPNRLEKIDRFFTTAEQQILNNRPSHLGVKKLFDILKEKRKGLTGASDDEKVTDFVGILHTIYQQHRNSMEAVRTKAKIFFEEYYCGSDQLSKKEFNVLLYGNSQLVTKALCGFRDALLKANGQMNPSEIYNSKAERAASQRLRLFVCEAEPKTQTAFGDRLTYHDGSQYSLYLKRYGFTNIIIIPDIVAGHIFENITIDFVILGADGVTPEYFMHSAGHASIVNLAWEWRARKVEDDNAKAKILLVTSYEKCVDMPKWETREYNLTNETVEIDGCKFWRGLSYGTGPEAVRVGSREHVWMTRDHELLKKICSAGIAFFNPKGDRIPINRVDFIITDKGSGNVTATDWKTLF